MDPISALRGYMENCGSESRKQYYSEQIRAMKDAFPDSKPATREEIEALYGHYLDHWQKMLEIVGIEFQKEDTPAGDPKKRSALASTYFSIQWE